MMTILHSCSEAAMKLIPMYSGEDGDFIEWAVPDTDTGLPCLPADWEMDCIPAIGALMPGKR